MTKQLVGTLVGGLILFFWQFFSFGVINLHESEMTYTPKQDQILEALNAFDLEEGTYMLPNVAAEDKSKQQELMQPYVGKPWVQLSYHKSLEGSMTMNLIRGFVIDLLSAFLLVWLLMKFEHRDFMTCVTASVVVGLIGYLTIPYLNTIWFKTSSLGYLVDAFVVWGLVGAWLGWWLNRK